MKTEKKKDIRSLSLEDLRRFFTENQDQAFRGNQVYQGLCDRAVPENDDGAVYQAISAGFPGSEGLLDESFGPGG